MLIIEISLNFQNKYYIIGYTFRKNNYQTFCAVFARFLPNHGVAICWALTQDDKYSLPIDQSFPAIKPFIYHLSFLFCIAL